MKTSESRALALSRHVLIEVQAGQEVCCFKLAEPGTRVMSVDLIFAVDLGIDTSDGVPGWGYDPNEVEWLAAVQRRFAELYAAHGSTSTRYIGERRYLTGDADQGRVELVVQPPDGNGDWYVSIVPEGHKIARLDTMNIDDPLCSCVRVVTSGERRGQEHVAGAVAALYRAMGGERP